MEAFTWNFPSTFSCVVYEDTRKVPFTRHFRCIVSHVLFMKVQENFHLHGVFYVVSHEGTGKFSVKWKFPCTSCALRYIHGNFQALLES